MAARAEYKSKAGFAAEKDLLAAVEGGSVRIAEVKDSELPEPLKGKSLAEKKAHLSKVSEERTVLKRRLADLAKKREKFIADKVAKTPASKDGFDVRVTETLREQAKSVGIRY
jgi:hypothetical protein